MTRDKILVLAAIAELKRIIKIEWGHDGDGMATTYAQNAIDILEEVKC